MCGRARSSRSPQALAQAFGVPPGRVYRGARYQPRYNLHPGNASPVLVREDGRRHSYHREAEAAAQKEEQEEQHASGTTKEKKGKAAAAAAAAAGHEGKEEEAQEGEAVPKAGQTSVVVMTWGLVPSWHKKGEKPDFFRAFNARSETVASKPFFKRLVNSRRCVVALDGFYEWVLDAQGQKQPYFVHYQDDGRPMTFAGLYDCWEDAEQGQLLYTYTILTRDPHPDWAWLHNRFPLVLPDREAEARWLDVDTYTIDQVLPALLKPVAIPGMVCHPCSKKMNNMRYEAPDASDPIKLEPPAPGSGGKAGAAAAAAAPAGTPTLHKFFGGGKGKETGSKASPGPAPYHSPPHARHHGHGGTTTTATATGKHHGDDDDDDDEVVILTPSAEEARGGGDVGKHAASAAVVAAAGGGGKKRAAAASSSMPTPVEGEGKRVKKEEKQESEAADAFFPKSK